ncbi:hypothetical protein BC829DRAFT_127360 [Chytridium lagenaria]|nr:hypothetical protein BC829DRAFT_127360 [Chytridium lagenaria]
MNLGLQERLYYGGGMEPNNFDDMEDSSMRMVDWVVGKESPQPPSDEEEDMERRIWMARNAGRVAPEDAFARRSSANAPTANGPRTFANVAAGSLKESDLYKKVNGVPASSSPQAGFRQRPILPAYLADALGPENIALQREAGRLRAGSITRYGGGGDMDSDLPFEISDLDINEQPNPPQRFLHQFPVRINVGSHRCGTWPP